MKDLLKNGTHFLFRRQSSILSAAAVIMVTFGLSHLIGLLKTRLLISYFFGSSAYLLDVYYAAFVIPDTIFQLLVIGSLSAAFIPVFSRHLAHRDHQAWNMAASTLNLVLLLFCLTSFFIFIFAPQLSRLLAPGFTQFQLTTLSQLLRILLFAQFFFSISGFLTAMIQSHQRFLIPALAPIVYNLGIIAGIVFLSSSLGIFGPAVGAVLGSVLHMAVQLPAAIRLGFRPSLSIDRNHPGVREVARLMPHRALALGVDQIEQLVAVFLASTLASGSLSLLNVARILYSIPTSLFGVTIGQAALPTLSRQSSDSDRAIFGNTFINALLQVTFLALPISILFIVLRVPVVRLVFGVKTFPWSATLLTGKVLALLSISAAAAASLQLISRAFYALHNTRTPLRVGLAAAVLNIVSSTLAVRYLNWGILGLAAVISLTAVLETLALFLLLRPHLSNSGVSPRLTHRLFLPLVKMVITSFITGVSLWVPMRFLDQLVFDTTRTLPLIALTATSSFIGLVVYLLLSYLFRVDELYSFLGLVARLKNWRTLLTPPPPSEPLFPPDHP